MLRIGRRGAALLILAGLHTSSAGWVAQRPAEAAHLFLLPLPVLWTAWAITAALCLLGALWRRFDEIAFAASMTMIASWAGVDFYAWTAGRGPGSWIIAVIWLMICAFVWLIAGWPDPNEARRPGRRTPPNRPTA